MVMLHRGIALFAGVALAAGCTIDPADLGKLCTDHKQCSSGVCSGVPEGICVIPCEGDRECPDGARCFDIVAANNTTYPVCMPNCGSEFCDRGQTLCDPDGTCVRRYPCEINRDCPRYDCPGGLSSRWCFNEANNPCSEQDAACYCYPQSQTCQKVGGG